jgi:hypothetical protein
MESGIQTSSKAEIFSDNGTLINTRLWSRFLFSNQNQIAIQTLSLLALGGFTRLGA